MARVETARPKAEMVLAILKSGMVEHMQCAKLASTFWLVPKKNFLALPLPRKVADAIISEDEIRSKTRALSA